MGVNIRDMESLTTLANVVAGLILLKALTYRLTTMLSSSRSILLRVPARVGFGLLH